MDTQTHEIARAYDQVPYTSRPFPQSQPRHLAALGQLFGLAPPDVSTAHVLELGCASGGNLIPLAVSNPHAQFIGIDLSPLQIAQGQKRIERLGLKNIRLITMSISDVTRGLGTFDYIICHGVYSWVPAAVRDAILRVSHDNLSDHGIAYISYNVFPGWRLRGVLRDAMLFHGETSDRPAERLSLGRDFLTQLGSITNSESAYGQMLRHEAQAMSAHSDDYVTHEYLELNNEPCYVSNFFNRLAIFGLSYLTEAEVHQTIAENFGAQTGALLRSLSGNRLDRMEQYIDFLTGRTFRQTLVVREDQASRIQRTLNSSSIRGLYISTRVSPGQDDSEDRCVFTDPVGRTLTTSSPAARKAIEQLAGLYPFTATAGELAAATAFERGGDPDGPAEIESALFSMVLAGMASISTIPIVPGGEPGSCPQAASIARSDARDGMTWTTNARHETVPLNLVQRAILPLLDGANDRGAIEENISHLVAGGQISFEQDGSVLTDPDQIRAAISIQVGDALASLQRAALLT